MLCKGSLLITLLAASAQLVVANTPSCLLAAINTQDNPADIQAVCKNASSVEQTITSTCGSNAQAAMAAFKSVCQGAGVAVSAYASSTSTSAGTISASATGGKYSATSTIVYTSHYYDTSCSCTKATTMTGTAYVGPSGIATGTSGVNSTVPARATAAASSGATSTGSSAIAGAASASTSSSSSGTSTPSSTGAAGRIEIAGLSMGALALAGLAMVL